MAAFSRSLPLIWIKTDRYFGILAGKSRKDARIMLKLTLTLDKIGYDGLIDLLSEKLAESGDPKLRMAAMLPKGMVKALTDDKKEEITALLLDRCKDKLAESLTDLAKQNGLTFEIRDARVERV